MFSYLSPETRVRKDHPLRAIRFMVDEVLAQLSRRFDSMYASAGRPSIPPEKLLRAQLLQMLYSIRSERLLMEEIDYSVLFRWFVGLNLDEEVWDATTFTKNRDRVLEAEVAKEFLAQVVARARTQGLTSDEHFTVDGTLLEAWAGAKSFENCFTMSQTGGVGVKSAPCLKSKRRFRLKCVRTRSDHETTSGPSGTQRGSSTARHYVGGLARRRRLQPPQDFRHCTQGNRLQSR